MTLDTVCYFEFDAGLVWAFVCGAVGYGGVCGLWDMGREWLLRRLVRRCGSLWYVGPGQMGRKG